MEALETVVLDKVHLQEIILQVEMEVQVLETVAQDQAHLQEVILEAQESMDHLAEIREVQE